MQHQVAPQTAKTGTIGMAQPPGVVCGFFGGPDLPQVSWSSDVGMRSISYGRTEDASGSSRFLSASLSLACVGEKMSNHRPRLGQPTVHFRARDVDEEGPPHQITLYSFLPCQHHCELRQVLCTAGVAASWFQQKRKAPHPKVREGTGRYSCARCLPHPPERGT